MEDFLPVAIVNMKNYGVVDVHVLYNRYMVRFHKHALIVFIKPGVKFPFSCQLPSIVTITYVYGYMLLSCKKRIKYMNYR